MLPFKFSKKSVDFNSQLGSPWRGKIHQDQPLLQQHTTAATLCGQRIPLFILVTYPEGIFISFHFME
jgi:hypothetical protein